MANITTYETSVHDVNKPLTFPGQYEFKEITIGGIDFLNKAASIVIFENLSNPYVTGEMMIIDNENLASTSPLLGGELITIEAVDCYKQTMVFTYVLTKISEREPASMGAYVYTIHFASRSYIMNAARKVSKAYPSTNTEKVVEDICKNYLDTQVVNWSSTAAPISCIIPNWRPAYALKWLASRSVSSRDEFSQSPYLMFQEKNDIMNIIPLDMLYNEGSNRERGTITIKYGRMTEDNDASLMHHERMGVHQLSFEDFKIVKTTDYVENLQNGMYKARVDEVDMFARDYNFTEYNYEDEFNNASSQHLNPYPFMKKGMYGADDISYWRSIPVHAGLFSDESNSARIDTRTNFHVSKWQQTEQMVIRGMLPGSFEVRIGQKYRIEVPAYRKVLTNKIESLDETYTGNYIIEAIKHEFTPNGKYFITVQAFTDSISRKV